MHERTAYNKLRQYKRCYHYWSGHVHMLHVCISFHWRLVRQIKIHKPWGKKQKKKIHQLQLPSVFLILYGKNAKTCIVRRVSCTSNTCTCIRYKACEWDSHFLQNCFSFVTPVVVVWNCCWLFAAILSLHRLPDTQGYTVGSYT